MPWPHRDHWVEESRLTTDVLSLDANDGLEFALFRVLNWLGNTDALGYFAWCQSTECLMRSVEIVPGGIRIKTLLD